MFVGRKRELSLLEKVHESNRSAFIPIYGRRRVGKSQLILHFLKDKPGIYYLGKTASAVNFGSTDLFPLIFFVRERAAAFTTSQIRIVFICLV